MLRIGIGFFLLLALTPAGGLSRAAAEDTVGGKFNGEVLKYDIRFWLLGRVGEGESVFRDMGNERYEARHDARTIGIAGWLSRYRRDTYRSTMGTINRGKRLIPLRFEEDVVIGKTTRNRVTTYDYAARKIAIVNRSEGKDTREEVDIPFGVLYDDPMTAFYNFRGGVYGKVEPGKQFLIQTAPMQGKPRSIRLTVATNTQAEKWRVQESDKDHKDLFVSVQMDRELVGSLRGLVYTWFTRDLVPVRGVAKDVFFWGDITGNVTYHGFERGAGGRASR